MILELETQTTKIRCEKTFPNHHIKEKYKKQYQNHRGSTPNDQGPINQVQYISEATNYPPAFKNNEISEF